MTTHTLKIEYSHGTIDVDITVYENFNVMMKFETDGRGSYHIYVSKWSQPEELQHLMNLKKRYDILFKFSKFDSIQDAITPNTTNKIKSKTIVECCKDIILRFCKMIIKSNQSGIKHTCLEYLKSKDVVFNKSLESYKEYVQHFVYECLAQNNEEKTHKMIEL